MSNEQLNKYKELHAEFTAKFVQYYNRNLDFINRVSHDGNLDLKNILKEMIELSKEMKRSIFAVYQEMRINRKEELAAKRAQRNTKNLKRPPLKQKKEKKNVNNSTTTNTIR